MQIVRTKIDDKCLIAIEDHITKILPTRRGKTLACDDSVCGHVFHRKKLYHYRKEHENYSLSIAA